MSVLPNQTNATPTDAFFWRVNASTITAGTFVSNTVDTNNLSTGTLSVGNISTTGSIVVAGDINALNVTASDTLTSYFNNSQYATVYQIFNVPGVAIIPELSGNDAVFINTGTSNAYISSMQTTSITLDGNTLDTGGAGTGAVLLLNGIPIATTSTSISSLTEWSYYPALSTVYFEGNNILEVGELSGNIVNVQTLSAFDAAITNQLTIGQTLFGNQAEFQEVITQDLTAITLEALSGSISTLGVSTLTTNSVVIPTGTFSNLTASNINTTNITAVAGSISDFGANSANIASANITSINATNATISGTLTQNEVRGVNGFINEEAANRIRIRVQGSADVFSSPELDLEAGGGNRGIVNVIANPGYAGIQGEVNITAKGGSAVGYATGGLLNLTAVRGTSVLGTASYSRVGIAADSITSYAGGPTPFAGVYGYNFIYGLLGVSLVAGTPPTLPNVAGTVYLYGLNPLGTGSSGGVRVQNGISVDVIYPYPYGFIAPEYDLIIRGNPAGNCVTLSNVRYLFGNGSAIANGFGDINTVNLFATNLQGTSILGSNITGSNINALIGNISSLNSLNGAITQLYNVSTINGLTVDQLVSTVTPPQFYSTVSTFSQLFTSSLQAANISSITANVTQLSGVSTLNGYTVEQLISSVSPLVYFSTVSTFQQLYTSSFQANTISTNTLQASQILLNGFQLFPQQSTTQQLFTSSLQANTISTGLLTVSTINGYNLNDIVNPQQTSTFLELYASTGTIYNASNLVLNVSSINGFNTAQFLSTTGTQQQISTFQQLFTSSFQANSISSGTIAVSSLNGYNISQFLNTPQLSTFSQLYTSSLQATNISSGQATLYSISGVSTINGFTINEFVSSAAPPVPQLSTFQQFFTSSFAANTLTPFQTSSLTLAVPGSLIENAGNYNLTVASNIDINSSNAVSIYNTNTAPTVGTNDLYILGQGTTTLAGQANTNVNAINNLLLNSGQITTVQGGQYVLINTSQQLQLNGSNEITATSSNIRLNGNLVINGVPYNPNPTSSFTTLATDVLRNNTTNNLMITAPFGVNLSTGNQVLITSGEVLTYSRGITDFFATTGIALSTQIIRLDAPITNIQGTLNAPQINTSSIVGNVASIPLQYASTIYTNTLRNNDSLGNELNIIAAYPSISSIATLIEGQNISLLATDQGGITAPELYISTGDTYIDGDVALTNSLTVKALSNLSSINGLPYTPGGGGGPTVSTFQQLFTSSIVLNAINGAAYPPPGSQTVSTFQQLFTSSIVGTDATFSNITLVGGTAELFATEGSLQINASNTLTLGGGQGAVLLSLSNNILIEPGFLTPAQLVIRGDTNLSNNNLLNVGNINGFPYQPSQSASTFSTLFTSSILMNTGTFCNLLALGTDPYIRSVDDLSISASNTLAIVGQQGLGILSLSNDISIAAGFSGPGEVRITASPLNLCNFDINNVSVLNATTINNTTLNNTTINTTTLNGRTATLSTINAELANISSATISTINTFPYHKAFGTAWATGTTPMVGGVPTGVDWGGTHYFNLSDILSGEASLLPGIQPRNQGVYQVNARATFSNSDSVVATASAYLGIDGYDDLISRVSVEVEPSRTATAIINSQCYIGENVSLTVYSDNSNVQLYEYPAGGPYPPYRAYCANITLQQLYSYNGGGGWPTNPLVLPPPPT